MEGQKTVKRWTALLLTAAVLLCGCGGRKKTAEEGAKQTVPQTILTFTHCWAERGVIDEIMEDYSRLHPEVLVEAEYIPVEQYVNSLKNRCAAGELPDIYMGWPGSSMEWFYQNRLACDLSGEEWVDRLDSKTRDDVTFDSEVKMLPLNKTFICMGYNKGMFEKYGCGLPGNYEEFLAICETLKSEGILPIALGSRDSSGYIYPSWMMAASDIYAFDPFYDQKLYGGTEAMSEKWGIILERQREWLENGCVDKNQLAIDRMSESLDWFAEGKAGMFVMGSWESQTISKRLDAAGTGIEMGYFPMPSEKDSGILVYASGEGLCVNAGSGRTEEALEVLGFFTEKEPNQKFQNAMNSFSTFSDLALLYNPLLSEISGYVENRNTWGYSDAAWPRKIGDQYTELFPQYLAGKISEKTFFREMELLWKSER